MVAEEFSGTGTVAEETWFAPGPGEQGPCLLLVLVPGVRVLSQRRPSMDTQGHTLPRAESKELHCALRKDRSPPAAPAEVRGGPVR